MLLHFELAVVSGDYGNLTVTAENGLHQPPRPGLRDVMPGCGHCVVKIGAAQKWIALRCISHTHTRHCSAIDSCKITRPTEMKPGGLNGAKVAGRVLAEVSVHGPRVTSVQGG
jgi:hypothetical protein